MSVNNSEKVIQYVPFMTFVHPSFWHTLTELKLDVDKLNDTTRQIYGRFTYRDDIGPIFEVDGTSFNKTPHTENMYQNVSGTIMNKNTIENFKAIDKAALLNSIGEMIWGNIKQKLWIKNPCCLLNFIILSYADLKKFHYYYWFAFPTPSQPTVYVVNQSECISTEFSNKQIEDLAQSLKGLEPTQRPFFTIMKSNDTVVINLLADILSPNVINQELPTENMYFAFTDPSNGDNPGWPLRMFMAALLEHCPNLCNTTQKVIGIRSNATGNIDKSILFSVQVPQNIQSVESAGWVGWERNDKGNFGPKLANMSASMDPVRLADTSSDLNIKLMKWRLVPDIDVEIMKTTKCLLLGAGTLGCHVARDLLAWGFRHITFLDNGKVSYSNPTRQVLYKFEDCVKGRMKSEAAANSLKEILPTVISEGITAHIPMPGHPVGDSLREETIRNVNTIEKAIMEHDVIFLLLDTREARWLPTLIAAHHGKIVINAALGFDSYLVMRHGVGMATELASGINSVFVPGGQLGCYFCNDVTAPGNSIKDRTLDQQCTVTRPGVAAIAGALAVEILVGMLQHPLRSQAPAPYNISDDSDLPQNLSGVLGPIPHSIRGFLHSYQTVLPTCTKFKLCIACSDVVIDKYRAEGMEFLMKVFNSGNYLEEVTGLAELHLTAEMTEILTFSDEDED